MDPAVGSISPTRVAADQKCPQDVEQCEPAEEDALPQVDELHVGMGMVTEYVDSGRSCDTAPGLVVPEPSSLTTVTSGEDAIEIPAVKALSAPCEGATSSSSKVLGHIDFSKSSLKGGKRPFSAYDDIHMQGVVEGEKNEDARETLPLRTDVPMFDTIGVSSTGDSSRPSTASGAESPMLPIDLEITPDPLGSQALSDEICDAQPETPAPLILTGYRNEEDEWDDEDFVFVTQTTRALNIVEGILPPRAESIAAPSAPPLFLAQDYEHEVHEPYVNKYSPLLAIGDLDYALSPANDELFRILADYDGSQTMLDAYLGKVKNCREKIQELKENAWLLEEKMLLAEENGDIKAVPYHEEISWSRRLLEGLKSTLFSQGSEVSSTKEGAVLVATLQPGLVKEREQKKAELRSLIDEVVDRALIASMKRHQANELVRSSLRDRTSIRTTCDALMHYETRDRDVSFVTKSIRQLLGWAMNALLDAEEDDTQRLRNQVWLIRRAKRYALKNPPRALTRILEPMQRGVNAHWALDDWIDRWMVILHVIVEKPSLRESTLPPGTCSVILSRSSRGNDGGDVFAGMVVTQFEQDEEILLALFANFPYEQGLDRILEADAGDAERMMARIWFLAELIGEACSRFKSQCPRFSAELATKLCLMLNRTVGILKSRQAFFDRLVRRAGIHLMDRACVVDVSPALKCISDRAAWSIFCATMCFAGTEDDVQFDFGAIGDAEDMEDEEAFLYRDLVGYHVAPAVKQFVKARTLSEWLRVAPSVRGHFNKHDEESHLARCDFLANLAASRGGPIANAIVRELLGLSYFSGIVPPDLVNPLLSNIITRQSPVMSLLLHIVALNDAVFFVKNTLSVQGLLTSPTLSLKRWEPIGERDLRFFRDWLSRDPADPRSVLASELLEKLDHTRLNLDTSRNLARMLAMLSVADGNGGDSESVSLVYAKTLGAFRRGRLVERFWEIVQRLRLDEFENQPRDANRSPSQRSRASSSIADDAAESEMELLQLTRKQNPSQALLAYVVGCMTQDPQCLQVVARSGRLAAARNLAKIIARHMMIHLTSSPVERTGETRKDKDDDSGTEFSSPDDEGDDGNAADLEEERRAAILNVMRVDPKSFVSEVVLPTSSSVPSFEFWIRMATEKDVEFLDLILRHMNRFDLSSLLLDKQFPSRQIPSSTISSLPAFLAAQLLVRQTVSEMPLWFGLGRVLVEQAGTIPSKELLETSDRVMPDLLKLSGTSEVVYTSPSSMSFFGWLDLLLGLDEEKERHTVFAVASQFFFSLIGSRVMDDNNNHNDHIAFGHLFWLLAPTHKRSALRVKMARLAKCFHSDASRSGEFVPMETRNRLMQLGEIAHYAASSWLGGSGVEDLAPLVDPASIHPSFVLFQDSLQGKVDVRLDRIIMPLSGAILTPSDTSREVLELIELSAADTGSSRQSSSSSIPAIRLSSLNSASPSMQTSMMMMMPMSSPTMSSIASSEGKRRTLIALLRRSASAVADARSRILQLDELEMHQFAALYVSKSIDCPVMVDKLYAVGNNPVPAGNGSSGGGHGSTNGKKKHDGKKIQNANHNHNQTTNRRPEIVSAKWTCFALDVGQKAAIAQTESKLRSEFESLLGRFAPGPAADELCDAVSVMRSQLVELGKTDKDGAFAELKTLLEFDCTQLCTCKSLRDVWISVVTAAVVACDEKQQQPSRDDGDKHQQPQEAKARRTRTSLYLLDNLLRYPWRIQWFHSLAVIDSDTIVEAYEKFFSVIGVLETNDAILLLKRMDAVKLVSDEQVSRLLELILAAFGKRHNDMKVLDNLRRGVFKALLPRFFRNDENAICFLVKALVRGGEDGGPLPPPVWTEISSVSDSVWSSVPPTKAQEALDELSSAFSRIHDRQSLVPCWISLAPSLCRRASSLDSILASWSPWVLSRTAVAVLPGGKRQRPMDEEPPLVNGFIACLQRLMEELAMVVGSGSPVSGGNDVIARILMDILHWFSRAVCAGRSSVALSAALLRLNWAAMVVPLSSSKRQAEDVMEALESMSTYASTIAPEQLTAEGETSTEGDDHALASSTMDVVLRVLEKSSFAHLVATESEKNPSGEFLSLVPLLERAMALGIRCANKDRSLAMLFSLPLQLLPNETFSQTLFDFSSCTSSSSATKTESKVIAEFSFAIAIAVRHVQRVPRSSPSTTSSSAGSSFALTLTRFLLESFLPAFTNRNVSNIAEVLMTVHSCLRFIRTKLKDLNGDDESCIAREILTSLKDDESDQLKGFCFEKTILSSNALASSSFLRGVAPLATTVDYISIVARSFLPTFLKTSVSSSGHNSQESEGARRGLSEQWSDDWNWVLTRVIEPVLTVHHAMTVGTNSASTQTVGNLSVGVGCVLRLFASGKDVSGLLAREACAMPLIIREQALARILNELGSDCDLRDFAERCEQVVDASLVSGSALVVCAALHRRAPGFDRLAPACNYLMLLDFRLAGRDAYHLVADIARNLSLPDSVSLSRPFKIDRAMFVSARLEQVSQTLSDPKERLAAAALADAFRICSSKGKPSDPSLSLFSTLECSGLKGNEVEWVKANAKQIRFITLGIFADELRGVLWPSYLACATKLTPLVGNPTEASDQVSFGQREENEMFVAL